MARRLSYWPWLREAALDTTETELCMKVRIVEIVYQFRSWNFHVVVSEIPVTSDTQTQSEDNLNYLARLIVGYHFCQSDNSPTCHVSQFVHSLAAQLSQCPQLASYHHLLQTDVNVLNHLSWTACNINPSQALVKGILEPLTELERSGKISVGMGIIVIDGLCEAEHHRPDYGDTIATFIGRHSSSFPSWLKIVATIRSNFVDTYKLLPFHRIW